jgi:hypothetical protein
MLHKPIDNRYPMQSRTQLLRTLQNLKSFLFIGYIDQQAVDVHTVRLQFRVDRGDGGYSSIEIADFRVTECQGYLRAVSLDGRWSFSRLT